MSQRKAIITGVTGQDGSYLAELLLSKGYEVHAVVRPASTFNRGRIEHIDTDIHTNPSFILHYGDLADSSQLTNMVRSIEPDEVYHLGALSHVKTSFDMPEYTAEVTGIGTVRILESIRHSGIQTKMYQASSSEMFGAAPAPQDEKTAFHPLSPYACSKVYSYWMTRNYREGYGMWCSNGIFFNHESPRRGPTFVTRKVAAGVAAILARRARVVYLGKLSARRDWGYAPEYVEAMWKILQLKHPDDFVLGTGESHEVRAFVEAAFSYAGLSMERHVQIDKRYFRPIDVGDLRANAIKASKQLNWDPKIRFHELVKIMVDAEFRSIGLRPIGEGDEIVRKTFPNRWWNDDRHQSFLRREGVY